MNPHTSGSDSFFLLGSLSYLWIGLNSMYVLKWVHVKDQSTLSWFASMAY